MDVLTKGALPRYLQSIARGDVARRAQQGAETLCRVTGASRGSSLRILDATAGLGRESYLMASAGAEVHAVERLGAECADALALEALAARANDEGVAAKPLLDLQEHLQRNDAGANAGSASTTAPATSASPRSGIPDAFDQPGKHGIGVGWRPSRADLLSTMGRSDGALYVKARSDSLSIACGPDIPVTGKAAVRASIKAEGLSSNGSVLLQVSHMGADRKPLRDGDNKVVLTALRRAANNKGWQSVDATVAPKGASYLRTCLWVRGGTGQGWIDAVQVTAL